jgi:hypothetical protein
MIQLETIHLSTVKAIKNHAIDYRLYDSIEELRQAIKKKRYENHKEKWRPVIRQVMAQKYKDNPEKYRDIRKKYRQELCEKDPSYRDKINTKQREYYHKKKIDKFKVLELPINNE